MTKLSTTSYAILGQLALRSWSAYELTAEMKRNFHYFWPRAESGIYAEVKRLAELGLVQSEQSYVGKRGRVVYSITPQGRETIAEWLSTPPGGFSLEFEGLLRVFFSRFGAPEQLVESLKLIETDAREMINVATGIGQEYLDRYAPFQSQVDIRAFVFDFLLHYAFWVKEWAERTRIEVESWDQLSQEERQERGLRLIEEDMIKFKIISSPQITQD